PVVLAVRDDDRSVGRYPDPSGELHRAGGPAEPTPLPPGAVRVSHLRALIEHVGDEQSTRWAERDTERLVEATRHGPHPAQRVEVGGDARGGHAEALEAVLEGVADDDRVSIHEHARGAAELPRAGAVAADHRDERPLLRHVLDAARARLSDPEAP